MQVSKITRGLLLFALLLVALIAFGLFFFVTDNALSLWTRLQSGPAVLRYAFVALLALLLSAFALLTIRVLRPSKAATKPPPAVLDESAIRRRVASVADSGIDVEDAASELQRLETHRVSSELYIALFGAVSTGKSSLAKALLPDAEVEISPVAGSTTEVSRFVWQAPTGAEITIADLPGLEAVGTELDEAMMDEARRSHAVVFVTDGDLSRQQVTALASLQALKKPLIVTLNKADRFSASELQTVMRRMQERLTDATPGDAEVPPALIVTIAGGEQEVIIQSQSGLEETRETRERDADVSQLVLALEELLGGDLQTVNALRAQSLLTLATEKLIKAEARYRTQRAHQVVQTATRRAVVGALAAVTPGTDIVIQGYLGSQMTKSLCQIYGQTPRDLEIERFLDLSQSRVGKAIPLSLAIAGNGLKAFPGVGTIAGGLVHAVAYGLLFDAVGRGLSASLEKEGAFDAAVAADSVQKGMDEHLEQGVRRVAKLALDYREKNTH